jgi:hypothetical protein
MPRIQIAEPCHEKWEHMNPVDQGAFCKHCCKTVVDFTQMDDTSIYNYIQSKGNVPLCGRFRNTQLNRELELISPDVLLMNIPAWKKYLAILFICFSGFLTGCHSEKKDVTSIPLPEKTVSQRDVYEEQLAAIKKEAEKKAISEEKNDCGSIEVKEESTYYIAGLVGSSHDFPLFSPDRTPYDHSMVEQFFKSINK